MLSEDDYVKARENLPEPSRVKMWRIRFLKHRPPVLMYEEQLLIEEGCFERKLVRRGGATFWAWVADGRIYF